MALTLTAHTKSAAGPDLNNTLFRYKLVSHALYLKLVCFKG